MNISQITGQNIKKVRIAEGMTLDRLAKRIHKSKSTLSKYEQGSVKIDLETLKDKYIDLTVYPKRTLAVKRVFNLENKQMENRIHLPRYTVLKIKEVKISGPGSLVILSLEDRHGSLYETEVDLKYDVIVKNENYIEDLFGFGDIHQKYPAITDKRWAIIAQGDLEEGMNTDECRLSIGDPVEIQLKKDSRFETWFYNGKTLEFESGILQRFK